MQSFYKENTANAPRLATDKFFINPENRSAFSGIMDQTIRFIQEMQLIQPELWARFVHQFQTGPDSADGGWRGEYWGKMMRGACFTYSYTRDPELYETLRKTVADLVAVQAPNGRISSYLEEKEFDGWDIWSRKYVLLGMQYFLEICTDDAFAEQIKRCICGQIDYIMSKIGPEEEGKKPITSATRNWRGLNSSSLLEPIVRTYSLTKEQKYLDFASYIVNIGFTDVENLIELAYEDNFYPYQYPVTKAYEMTSCFMGLLEYYRITGNEKHKTAVINFANKVLESDFTIIGSSGCTHELFDHSTVRQANTTNGKIAQETCVTVTLMQFFAQLTLITGDPKYVDAFETSLYNAYLGAVNTEKVVGAYMPERYSDVHLEPLPFDSYSPLTADCRGNGVGGLKIMSDKHYYGCCACIGSAGCGLVHPLALLASRDGLVLNLFFPGKMETTTPSGAALSLNIVTEYPKSGEVSVTLNLTSDETFSLSFRNPGWSRTTTATLNGEPISVPAGYLTLNRIWKSGDTVTLSFDMSTEAIRPIAYGHDILMNKTIWHKHYMVPFFDKEDPIAHRHIALRRGPIVLAQENRLGYSVDDPIDVAVNADGTVSTVLPETDTAPYPHIIELRVPLTDGSYMTVTDYASAGKLWSPESKMAAWMLTKD